MRTPPGIVEADPKEGTSGQDSGQEAAQERPPPDVDGPGELATSSIAPDVSGHDRESDPQFNSQYPVEQILE